jgi:hypothetical protein
VGEDVATSPYSILTGSFTTPSTNYSAPTLVAGSTLAITPTNLIVDLTSNATKNYGTSDPSVNATTSVFTGRVNATVTDWNGNNTAIDDTAAGRITLASLTRTGGESVGSYNILTGTAGGTAIGNYTSTVNTNGHVLAITPATLTGTIGNQTKVYGQDDPALNTIAVTLGGVVNTSVTDWNSNVTAINDTGNVSATLSSLTRTAGETVTAPGPSYAISGGTLNALGGSAAGNYTASLSTAGKTLTITPAALTVDLTTNAGKTYGTNDSSVNATTPTFTGRVVATVTDWNGTNTAIDDTAAGAITLASLTRSAGENVGSYNILTGTAGGTAIGNYTSTVNTNGHVLAITPAALTVNLTSDAGKTYGTNDPSVNATTPTFTGRVNATVTDWNGTNTAIDDTAAGRITLASLTRTGGENVGSYNILTGTAGGTAIGNYTPTVNTNGHALNITPAALTITADDKSRLSGDPNPPFTATYSGFVQGNVTSWNGASTPINDTPASLGGSLVFATPATPSSPVGTYNITPSGQTSSNYAISYVDGTLTVTSVNPNANQVPADVLASIYSGKDQLPPPTVSGPTNRWGQLQGLPSAMPGVQPDSRTAGSALAAIALGDAGTSSGTPGVAGVAGRAARPRDDLPKTGVEPIPNGAVRDLVTIINGGVRMSPRQGGRLGWLGRR